MTGEEIVKRYNSMGDARGNWETSWQECADWCWPTNDNVNTIRTKGVEKPTQRLIDTCIEALYNFASGFFSHMFTPNMIWAKIKHPNPEIMADPDVAHYFEEVSRIIHSVLQGSNFAQEEFQTLMSIGCFGTNCMAIEEDDKNFVRFRNFTISSVKMDQNHLGEIDTFGREFEYSGKQAVQKFGMEALKKADLDEIIDSARESDEKKYKFIHFVTPRMEYDPKSKTSTNKPWASYYVCDKNKAIVKEGGFDLSPYVASRFTTGNDEIYGRGPMSMVLATARRTNVIYRTMLLSAEQNSTTLVAVPDDDSVKGFKRRAIDFIKWKTSNPNGIPSVLQTGDLSTPFEMYKMHEDQIKKMFFNHLFRSLEDYRNMTATEVNERVTMDLMSLASFVSRYEDEHIEKIINYVYYLCQKKKGMLPEPPVVLDDIAKYQIDYIGRLGLATKNFETLGAIQTARVFGELGTVDPRFIDAMDYMDHDDMFIRTWFAQSASMSSLKGKQEVDDLREARMKAAQMQQNIENMPKVADSIQKVSGPIDVSSVVSKLSE